MKEEIAKAIDQSEKLTKSNAAVNLKGKQYLMVKDRINIFRRCFGFDFGMTTEILQNDKERVLMKATITDISGFVIATGYSEELRDKGVNIASAIENGESSAWGRALSNLGLAGSEVASADEVEKAIQKNITINKQLKNEIEQKEKELKEQKPIEQKSPPPEMVKVEPKNTMPDWDSWFPGKHDQVKSLYSTKELDDWADKNKEIIKHYHKNGTQDQKTLCAALHRWFKQQKDNAIEQGRTM